MIKTLTQTVYQTEDGQVHASKHCAEQREQELLLKNAEALISEAPTLSKDVKDLLNQILIKLEKIPQPSFEKTYHDEKNPDYDSSNGYYMKMTKVPEPLQKLAAIKFLVEAALEDNYRASNMVGEYYDSTCWNY